jgi:tetratricopeptide (TPR) repeat protein
MPRSLALITVLTLFPGLSLGQDPARSRLEREAAGQAAQADTLFKVGQHAAALKLYRAERESRKTLGDARYEALALRGIGCCLAELGEEDGAIEAFTAARDLDAGRDDKGFEGYDGLLLANAQLRKGLPADAVATLDKAIPKLDQAIDRDHECDARVSLVTARLQLGQADKAQADADRSITLAEELDDPGRLADAWLVAGQVDHELGRLGLALERLQDARDAFREQDRPDHEVAATRHLANLSYRLGHPDRAARRFEDVIAIDRRLDDRTSEANDRLTLATIRLDLRDVPAATREARLALDAFRTLGDDASRIEAMVVLAQAQSRTPGGLDPAATTIQEAITLGVSAYRDDPAEQIRLLLLSAELEHQLGKPSEVSSRLDAAKALATKTADASTLASVEAARRKLIPGPKAGAR